MPTPSPEIAHRDDFGLLATARGCVDAVEIGTDQGVFAAAFLRKFRGHWLYCIDPYEPYDVPRGGDRTPDMLAALAALQPYHGRFRLVRAHSPECIPLIRRVEHIRPDFVYVDGSHAEADVYADLVGWWDVLPAHGILAGHDYDPELPGVVAAVDRFARERGLNVYLTHERRVPKSWYVYRNQPAELVCLT